MRIIHVNGAGVEQTLATNIEVADGIFSKAFGLMFRRSIPDDYGMIFKFFGVDQRRLHMVFVPFDIDVLWLSDGTVVHKKQLSAWTGYGSHEADMVIELPAGAAEDVSVGDSIQFED